MAKKRPQKTCPKCDAQVSRFASSCGSCGNVFKSSIKEETKPESVDTPPPRPASEMNHAQLAKADHSTPGLLDALDATRGHNAALLHVVETNAAARALYERRGFEAVDEGSLEAACAAAVAREIEGSDDAQILMRLPGTGKKPKPAKAPKKRKRSKGFSRKR